MRIDRFAKAISIDVARMAAEHTGAPETRKRPQGEAVMQVTRSWCRAAAWSSRPSSTLCTLWRKCNVRVRVERQIAEQQSCTKYLECVSPPAAPAPRPHCAPCSNADVCQVYRSVRSRWNAVHVIDSSSVQPPAAPASRPRCSYALELWILQPRFAVCLLGPSCRPSGVLLH